ncbi:MAG TPA: TraM recognition domain-containing protein [Candidatus Paceibacterota bacterium]|nr:TraM recognition domain-containing protein [Candidatus Paceibacterota bacterium]
MQLPQETFTTPAQEIAWLGEQSHKEYILQTTPGATIEDATKTTIESYARAEAKTFIHESRVMAPHEIEHVLLRLKPETHDQKIEALFGTMLERGIKNTLDIVKGMHDPHLEDDFHRFLVQYLHTVGALPGLKEKSALYGELRHTLFVVTLAPSHEQEKEGATFKTFIQAMKQFLMGMRGTLQQTSDYYVLELAVGHQSRDIALYVSVPSPHEQTFERLVHAYYPTAIIDEVVDDYNIFSSTAVGIAASIASLKAPAIFPIATDTAFEHDPLAALIGSLSQLEAQEGAAIQFVISTDTLVTNQLLQSVIDRAQKGDGTVKHLYSEATESLIKSVGKGLFAFFEKEKKDEKEKQLDTHGIELATAKNKSQTLSAGIRIIAAAGTLDRAKSVVQTIQASFQQFTLPNSNEITWNDVRASRMSEAVHDFTFRTLRPEQQIAFNVDELATLFHFPVGFLAAPELKEAAAATAPAPVFTAADSIIIGTNTYRGKSTEVRFAKEDRLRHCYVIGQTGTGKTVFLKNMIIQDIKNGDGVCFIDPHGNDIEAILANIPPERIDDVIYFDPAYTARPMGLNMLEYDQRFPEQKIFVINELLAIFNKLFDMKVAGGPMFEQYFRNSAGLVMEDPESGSTLLEIGRVLADKAFRDLKLSRCTNPIIKQFWVNAENTTGESALANFVPYITNKFDVFISNDIMRPVVAQQKSVLNFREIMDKKKILLVNLSKGRLGDINANLIGLLLVGKITMAALSRVDILGKEKVNDFYLYIDEFQNVTTDSIATILSEARKYRLSLTVAHQYIEQLEESIKNAVFGNVGTMAIHRVSPENANAFEQQLAPTFTPADIIKQENLNCYITMLVGGMPAKPFNSHTPLPPQGNLEAVEKLKELSYLKYGRPREEVEAEIMARYQ